MSKILDFFKGIKKELIRVRWPKKDEMFKFSISTIVILLFFMAFFTISAVIITFIMGLV